MKVKLSANNYVSLQVIVLGSSQVSRNGLDHHLTLPAVAWQHKKGLFLTQFSSISLPLPPISHSLSLSFPVLMCFLLALLSPFLSFLSASLISCLCSLLSACLYSFSRSSFPPFSKGLLHGVISQQDTLAYALPCPALPCTIFYNIWCCKSDGLFGCLCSLLRCVEVSHARTLSPVCKSHFSAIW